MPLFSRAFLVFVSFSFPIGFATCEEFGRIVFEDSFDREETQDAKDEVGNGWTTNGDKPWSLGPKQTDLRDGALYVTPANGEQSNVLVIRPAEIRNGLIGFRFLFQKANDEIGLVFADSQLKDVHAGHVMSVRLKPTDVKLTDMLTGAFEPSLYKKRKEKTISSAEKKLIASKTKAFDAKIEVGVWHDVLIGIQNDQLSVSVDEKHVGSFVSPGFAHPSKSILRVSVKRFGAIDSFRVGLPNQTPDEGAKPSVSKQ